jgi:hypothetical protein
MKNATKALWKYSSMFLLFYALIKLIGISIALQYIKDWVSSSYIITFFIILLFIGIILKTRRKKTIILTLILIILIYVNTDIIQEQVNNKTIKYDGEISKQDSKKVNENNIDTLQKHSNSLLQRTNSLEDIFLYKYQEILNKIDEQSVIYIQAYNKIIPCKIWTKGYNPDKLQQDTYKVFWDGECKDGYAYGIGREIEQLDDKVYSWSLAKYENKIPTYYIKKDIINNITIEGIDDINEDIEYCIKIEITKSDFLTDMTLQSFVKNKKNKISMHAGVSTSGNNDYVYAKVYPNFRYLYVDNGNSGYYFTMSDNNITNGWAITSQKDILTKTFAINNFERIEFTLPKSYLNKANKLTNEIYTVTNKSILAQAKALIIKENYKNMICNKEINFYDIRDYQLICKNTFKETNISLIKNKLLNKLTLNNIKKF